MNKNRSIFVISINIFPSFQSIIPIEIISLPLNVLVFSIKWSFLLVQSFLLWKTTIFDVNGICTLEIIIFVTVRIVVQRSTGDGDSKSIISFLNYLWLSFMELGPFLKNTLLWPKKPLHNFQKLMMDLNSPPPITFDQTLWNRVFLSKIPSFDPKNYFTILRN